MDDESLRNLRCPKDRVALKLASAGILAEVNRAIKAGEVVNAGGAKVSQSLSAALVREDEAYLYPIVDDIPVLLADEAIPLAPIRGE